MDIQTTGRSVVRSGDQGVRLAQARNQTIAVVATVVDADEWLSSAVDVADEADVADEDDDENVTLTMTTTEDKRAGRWWNWRWCSRVRRWRR